MRKPGYLQIGTDSLVTAKIDRGEFALEPKEIKELFIHIVKRAKIKYSFKLKNFVFAKLRASDCLLLNISYKKI